MKMKQLTVSSVLFSILLSFGSCQFRNDLESQLDLEDFDLEDVVDLKWKVIFPGTKWCGNGNKAANYDDLGKFAIVDACCREHDHCPDVMAAGETKNGLTNDGSYSKLNCECDTKFYNCLKAAKTNTSKMVGKTYFDVLGTQCYDFDYPITGCKRKVGIFRRTCDEYTYDTTQPKKWQWKDVRDW